MPRHLTADDTTTPALWERLPEAGEGVSSREPGAVLRPAAHSVNGELDSRFADLDAATESPFLRAQKRVPVRRGPVTKKTATRLRQVVAALAMLALGGAALMLVYRYGEYAARFRIASREQIGLSGNQYVARPQVLEAFGSDIGRNTFFVPLDLRQHQIEQIAWVESASIMRLLPDRIRVDVIERTPIAFAQVGARVQLIDADGVLLEPAAGKNQHYSFPVIAGMSEAEPRSTRAARMKIYQRLARDLDSGGAHYSENISEVDLSDPDDVKVIAADDNGTVLLHLGDANFLDRFKIYIAHAEAWRQQFHKLDSVDLRFEQQVIVNPDSAAQSKPPVGMAQVAPPAAKLAPTRPIATKHRAGHWRPLKVHRLPRRAAPAD